MPAKKAAKKAVAPAEETPGAAKKTAKKAVAKKAAAKTATAKKAPAAKKSKAAAPVSEPFDREKAAYLNYRNRLENGGHGDELGDWLSAGSDQD